VKNKFSKTIVLAVAFILIFETMLYGLSSYNNQTQINDLYPKYDSIETQIQNVFQGTLTISDGYLSFLMSDLDVTREETETFLNHLFSYDENYIKNIAVIEDTTIIFNYPYEANQSSIGVDLATIDGQSTDILRVKNNLESLFIGPVELVQGGQAFILRIPILNNDLYWGQIAVVIDLDSFEQLIINEADSLDVAINIFDNTSNKTVFEYGNQSSKNTSIANDYSNKYLSWTITITDTSNTPTLLFFIALRLIGYGFILFLSILIYKDTQLKHHILYNSTHDSLTDCYNRSKFISDYNNHQFDGKLIAFTDVNKFKLLNDTLGHSFGDWCLIQISNKFMSLKSFRTYRISGDEFILVSHSPMTIEAFMNEMPSNKFTFYSDEFQQNVDIHLSIGLFEKVDNHIRLESILMYLDYAMYDSKKEEKSLTIVNDELMKKYDDTKIIEQKLIEDIKNNELKPYYQPIINLSTKKIEGFEVLSRWLYKGKIRSAAMFIPIVKKIKYVDLVDMNLFNRLQVEYHELLESCDSIKNLVFSLNLSAETLMIFERNRENFDEFVKNLKMPVQNIIFEISEDMNLGLISIETLRYIQEAGFAISIDDFGSGVSKLADVLSGEIKTIKTDKALLPLNQSNDKKIKAFNTIINAIKASGATICVEGVETLPQLKIAIDAGCKLGQGYFFCKPIPKEKVIDFITNFNYDDYIK
jgi:diguanylate cyclase (GGDEF)-like protein